MANEKKSMLPEEYLRKFKHRTGYVINESTRYRPLVSDGDEFDELPVLTNEAGEQEDAPKPQGAVPPVPSNEPEGGVKPPVPAFDTQGNEPPADQPITPEGDPMAADAGMGMSPTPETAENRVDNLQNEIIRHNIEAMKSIHDQLESLNMTIQGLNSKIGELNADVEEVREPTNAEKLMNKTQVSYPYYFNLNDFWQDNWFTEKHSGVTEKGIKELPDGTYVADFDDLPHKSKIDVQNSFNDFNESKKKKNILRESFTQGMRVKVSDGSGVDSNKTGVVVSPREVKTNGRGVPTNIQGAYKPVDWGREVAVKLDDGEIITMFKNRLSRID